MAYDEPISTCNEWSAHVPANGVTVFGCGGDEAALFREVGARLGVPLTITEAALCETTAELARGSRCISVNHTARITGATLSALSEAGVEYLCTSVARPGGRVPVFEHLVPLDVRVVPQLGPAVLRPFRPPQEAVDSEHRNRELLGSITESCGFDRYDREWWHYTLRTEPHPDAYFDFPIT